MNSLNLINFFIILIPSLGMLSGLSGSVTIPLLLLILIKNSPSPINFSIDYKAYKLEIAFAFWCLISCIWSLNIISSVIVFFVNISLIYLYHLSTGSIYYLRNKDLSTSLTLGIIIAIALFFLESKTQGIIYSNFKYYFQDVPFSHQYPLYSLDRGCALLTISSWPLFNILIVRRKFYLSCLLYLVILYTLCLSDSLASLVGFIVSGVIFLLIQVLPIKLLKYIRILLIISSIGFPLITYKMNPYFISDHYTKILPDSAKHRLFIWNFVSKKIISQPISGYGFGSSKKYVAADEEIVRYKDYRWSPLPLHPHNNILQVLFETGCIGYILFLLIISRYLKKVEKLITTNSVASSIYYACFTNYFIIGMISFSALQTWWVASAIWAILLLKYSTDSVPKNNPN